MEIIISNNADKPNTTNSMAEIELGATILETQCGALAK